MNPVAVDEFTSEIHEMSNYEIFSIKYFKIKLSWQFD